MLSLCRVIFSHHISDFVCPWQRTGIQLVWDGGSTAEVWHVPCCVPLLAMSFKPNSGEVELTITNFSVNRKCTETCKKKILRWTKLSISVRSYSHLALTANSWLLMNSSICDLVFNMESQHNMLIFTSNQIIRILIICEPMHNNSTRPVKLYIVSHS